METFWFFWLRFRRAYDSAYDSDFLFPLDHKRSYDSVASENHAARAESLAVIHKFVCCLWMSKNRDF